MQAAVTVARRVAEELGCSVGQDVGYAIRFEEQTCRATRIVYLTGEKRTLCIVKALEKIASLDSVSLSVQGKVRSYQTP